MFFIAIVFWKKVQKI